MALCRDSTYHPVASPPLFSFLPLPHSYTPPQPTNQLKKKKQGYCKSRVPARAIQGSRAHSGRGRPRPLDKLLHVRQRKTNHRRPLQQRTRKFLRAPLRRRHRGRRDRHGDESHLGRQDSPAALRLKQGSSNRPTGRGGGDARERPPDNKADCARGGHPRLLQGSQRELPRRHGGHDPVGAVRAPQTSDGRHGGKRQLARMAWHAGLRRNGQVRRQPHHVSSRGSAFPPSSRAPEEACLTHLGFWLIV